ncbi:MAG: IS982 family transposase, partial [Wolbachia sp.]
SIIETVFGSLKNKFDTRHRSPINFLVHIFSTLVSYSMQPKKPCISKLYFVG